MTLAADPKSDYAAHARSRIPWAHWLIGAVLLVLAAQLVHFLVFNPAFEWDVVGRYLFEPSVLRGLGTTVLLAVAAMVVGLLLGTTIAACRLSAFAPLRWAGTAYVTVFRSIPPLVQLIFWFNLGYLLPKISLGLPFGPEFVRWSSNDLITPVTAAVLGLGLNEAAYLAEIVRAGLIGVDSGQRDAARSLGYTGGQTFFRVTLPQAMRVIIPPTGSQFITVLKGTSLVSVIAMADLLYSVQAIYGQTYQVVPLLVVACAWYLVVVSLFSLGQQRLERHFARGERR
ncbi:amino acid ABC transporter permease [Cryptosporangium phraense]|uniref:Amino acid ABC transporter permease n=1 Tax=Cryptosporangium phraense TaxID=2593070 RepID=A0A545AL94_9ACTN|nr:amino acid ABC transporter permease [Cryptosporangium phraense]TQS42094.1 amino acid ABC transporter permease [Cryptosporangium phraense]